MDEIIKKVIGKPKDESPLEKLSRINKGLKNLGCNMEQSSLTPPRKIVGRDINNNG